MNKLFQFIITSPPIPEQYTIKCLTVSSPDKGTAVAHVINDVEKNNPGIKFSTSCVAELDPDKFLKDLQLTKPVEYKVVEKVEEKSDLTKEQKFDSWAAMLRKNGYSVKKSRTILE